MNLHRPSTPQLSAGRTGERPEYARYEDRSPARPAETWNADHPANVHGHRTRRIVVVGNGMVGARFAEEVRRRDPEAARVHLTVLGAEPRPAYNRVLLSTVLAGGLSPRSVQLHPTGWAAAQRIDLRIGTTVTGIDARRRRVHLDGGGVEPYDELVLATGSRAWLPPVPGLADPTVTAFRDLADCERILAAVRPGVRFAVLGGGLLGCEAARGLAARGVAVTLVHPESHLMERQLEPDAGAVLAATMRRLGIDVRLATAVACWERDVGLRCADGSIVAADALVVATGVRPETGLAEAAGLTTDRGVVVDDRLATSAEHVSAIGDCARHPGSVSGLVQPGWEQAAVLADRLAAADPTARYLGTPAVTRLKARDVDLATVGDPADLIDDDNEVLRFTDTAGGRYAAVALRGDRLVGGAMIGLPQAAAAMVQFYDAGIPAPTDRLRLLLGRALPPEHRDQTDPELSLGQTIICRCNSVTKDGVIDAVAHGCTTVAALSRVTRAGTGCGGCLERLTAMLTWAVGTDPIGEPAAGGDTSRNGRYEVTEQNPAHQTDALAPAGPH
ncbi:FAD-dependent oxidoreductase [Pseudonocardia spinosispora]|uniref:FAD-dependent oxidoreductase n=1 Tax=Pseudonocardia spinosispora TaxID=103441 RepID=UPI000405E065|nr:FAD-dependent oxidoreductase [Pseudonocardia spinosispora]